jgi:hypothetical protein
MKLMVGVLVVVAIIALWREARKSSPAQTGESAQHSPKSIQLVSAQSAARRALCLASLVLRAKAEYQLRPAAEDRPDTDSTIDSDLVAKQETWMKQKGLWDAASPLERVLMEKPLGSWTRQEVADSQWGEEALAVLLWALKPGADLPPMISQPSRRTQ